MKRVTRSQDKWSEKGAKKSRTQSRGTKDCQVHITCDYCHKDITHNTRILCAVCAEFDLCVECFSAGVELRGHKYWHEYRIIEDLRFPFLGEDWTVAEEQLLLEGLELFGIRNWTYVADYVATKNIEQCRVHYEEYYMKSASWPQISFDHVRDVRMDHKEGSCNKRSKCPQIARKERRAAMKTQRAKKPVNTLSHPAHAELSGYMPKRGEFECEWDDACEEAVMNIEFSDQDTPEEFEQKMQALELYNRRLAKRYSMRKFAVEKKLHDTVHQAELKKARTPREDKLHEEHKKYMQVMSAEEYEEFIKGLAHQEELEEKIRQLQEYRTAGLTSMKEVPDYKKHLKTKQKKSLRSSNSKVSSSSSSSTSWSSSPPPSPSACPLSPISVTEDFVPCFSLPTQSPISVRSRSDLGFRFSSEIPSSPMGSLPSPSTRSRSKITRPVVEQQYPVLADQLQKRRSQEQSTTIRRHPATNFDNVNSRFHGSPVIASNGTGTFLRGADNVFVVAVI